MTNQKNKWASYLAALAGPVILSGANFLAALMLQRSGSLAEFGAYSFLIVIVSTGMSVSNGLFGTTIIFLLSQTEDKSRVISSYGIANLLASVVGVAAISAYFYFEGEGPVLMILAGIFALLTWLRWFHRFAELALHRRGVAVASDIVYGVLLIVSLAFMLLASNVSLKLVLLAQITALAASMFTFHNSVWIFLRHVACAKLDIFWNTLGSFGGWSFAANLASNLTANAPGYVIALFLSAQTYAPIAAVLLYFRPTGLVLTALVVYERPRMAGLLSSLNFKEAIQVARFIQIVVAGIWMANSLFVGLLIMVAPERILKEGGEIGQLWTAATLIGITFIFRVMREPESALIQAGGAFKDFGQIALVSAPVAFIIAVLVLSIWPEIPALTLLGALVGEALMFVLVFRRRRGGYREAGTLQL